MYGAMQGFVQCLGKYEGDPFETMFLKIEKHEPPQPQVGAVYVCMYDGWMDMCIVPVPVWQGAAGLIRFEDASLLRIWLEMGQEVLFDLSDKVRALHTYIHTVPVLVRVASSITISSEELYWLG
jgi:hypothetical protein